MADFAVIRRKFVATQNMPDDRAWRLCAAAESRRVVGAPSTDSSVAWNSAQRYLETGSGLLTERLILLATSRVVENP